MVTIIKIGGNVLDDEQTLAQFLSDFTNVNTPKMLVHGGGKIASEIGLKLGIEPDYIEGRRVTDGDTLQLVTMVYGGLINKTVVASLQSLGCNAIGLTGADGNIIRAVKRSVMPIDYGYVGDIVTKSIDVNVIQSLLSAGLCPVIAPLTHDGAGNVLNTNADTIAQALATALATIMPVQLIYCFEKDGVVNEDGVVISQITATYFEQLKKESTVSGGMIPKLQNALEAVGAGVKRVAIGNARFLGQLINGQSGTEII